MAEISTRMPPYRRIERAASSPTFVEGMAAEMVDDTRLKATPSPQRVIPLVRLS